MILAEQALESPQPYVSYFEFEGSGLRVEQEHVRFMKVSARFMWTLLVHQRSLQKNHMSYCRSIRGTGFFTEDP